MYLVEGLMCFRRIYGGVLEFALAVTYGFDRKKL